MFLPKNQLKFSSAEDSSNSGSSSGSSTVIAHQRIESDSVGSYEATPILTSDSETGLGPNPNCLYPSLVSCDEPIIAVMQHLANRPWMKAAEKSFADSGIFKISDLAKLTKTKAHTFDKFLKAPDSVSTIREALRKFEKTHKKRETEKPSAAVNTVAATSHVAIADPVVAVAAAAETVDSASTKKTGIASIVELSTPEEEDQTMQEIYDRPSPSPTEELSLEKESASESSVIPVLTQAVTIAASSVKGDVDHGAVAVEADDGEETEHDAQSFDSCDIQSYDKIENVSMEEPVDTVTHDNDGPVASGGDCDAQVLPTGQVDSADMISDAINASVVAVPQDDLPVAEPEVKSHPEQAADLQTPKTNFDAEAPKGEENISADAPVASTHDSEPLPGKEIDVTDEPGVEPEAVDLGVWFEPVFPRLTKSQLLEIAKRAIMRATEMD